MDGYRVCFVCSGNICRSPMAEAVFRSLAADAGLDGLVSADSAGTGGWHVGAPADPRTDAVLRGAGYELRHAARQFEPGWFAERDLVIALDAGHLRELRAMAPTVRDAEKVRLLRGYVPGRTPGAERSDGPYALDVPDPYYGGGDGFAECLRLVEEAMPHLLTEVIAELEARDPESGPESGPELGPGHPHR